jgi:para-aminobenzoate synthetase/4-amino-4-deoxychorismate lyase
VSWEEYRAAVESIKQYILDGDTYQVNYTLKLKFPWLSAPSLYCRLRDAQRVGYAAFLTLRGYHILSLSPELFFRIDGGRIQLKPMKGTAARGRTLEEDEQRKKELRSSEKNRAENLMIVDMLRNDVGRIAQTHSVRLRRFFEIERYETVFQATSTIEAKLRQSVRFSEVIRSLFPSGSVTGAPKIRTMQIIRELEKEPRGVYTGSVGFIAPQKRAVLSVAIRTVVLDRKTGTGEMGVGSGIVHDSVIEEEYRECLLKSRFLTESPSRFELIETMRWEAGKGFFLQHLHEQRLIRSAQYFGFPCDRKMLRSTLRKYDARLRKESQRLSFRVRLRLGNDGTISLTHARLEPTVGEQHVRLSDKQTDSSDRFLFHKTTNRRLYDEELERAVLKGYFDVLFLNEREQLTEGARTNLIIKKDARMFTPPVSCGLLAGVYREYLLRSKSHRVEERILTLEDLKMADDVYVCNAVRGMIKVRVEW